MTTDSMWPTVITACGAVAVGLLALVGVLIASGRTTRAMIAAEDKRHANSLAADRAQRAASAQYDVYVRVAGTLDRLVDVCRAISIAAKLSIGTTRRRIDPIKRKTLAATIDEIEQSLGHVFLLGSDTVNAKVRETHDQGTLLLLTHLVSGAVIEPSKHEAEAEKAAAMAGECLNLANESRSLMREEIRWGRSSTDAPSQIG